MRGSATSVNNNNDKAGNIVLNCRPTSLTILRDALHTLFHFHGLKPVWKYGSLDQPDEDLEMQHNNSLDACPARRNQTKQRKLEH